MIEELKELYQEVILDHSKYPRNFGKISPCSHEGHGYNPLCGDAVNLYLNLDPNDVIEGISFDGQGCAISIASASLMTDIVKGKTPSEAKDLFDSFHSLVTGDNKVAMGNAEGERLKVLAGVRQFPMRVKCATLPWHAMQSALNGQQKTTTE
jgi:nitrogen fixation protein NifU and related proteins